MSQELKRREAEACAGDLIVELGIATFPVNPKRIAQGKDIMVEARSNMRPGVSGVLMKQGDQFGIVYSKVGNEGFENFTIAHELGHYFLPGHPEFLFSAGNLVHESQSGFISDDPYERQADHFAAALLMPEKLFKKVANSYGAGFAAISTLARKCETSLTATAIRYSQFVDYPVAVILSSGQTIEACFASPLLKDLPFVTGLRKGDLLSENTATSRFNAGTGNMGSCNSETASCYLDDWFEDSPRIEMNEDVVGLGKSGRTLTVIFTENEIDEDS